MSGGMGRAWTAGTSAASETLADRSGRDPVRSGRDERAALSHHCWVRESPGGTERHAGLLLEWRRDGARWFGLVIYVQRDERNRFRLTQRWVPADLLEPADRG